MDLTHLTDLKLMQNAKSYVKQESNLLTIILHHIKEIDRRRLYADYKQPGLLELVMSELGYPKDQAVRRLQAMRMMRDNPIIEEKIESGELSLTTIGIVQTLFSHEKKEGKPLSQEQKNEVIERVCGKSTREAQKIVFSICSTPAKLNERLKMISADLYELTTTVDEETVQIIDQLKGMLAHSHPNISNGELIKMLGKLGLKEFERVKQVAAPLPNSKVAAQEKNSKIKAKVQISKPEIKTQLTKAETKRQIWKRDQNKCTNCGSTYAVQEDHRHPKAKGGKYTLTNMRLLCRSCNQRAAIQHFGVSKMGKYLERSQ